jgi:LEA14-like dessication related protein
VRACFLFAALALATACSRPEPPTLTPRSAKITALTAAGLDLMTELDAENPNDIALSAQSMTAKITLDGRYDVGTVKVATPLAIPAHKTEHLSVPLSVRWTDVTVVATLAAQNRSIPYAIDGTVALGGDSLHVDVPFHMTGSVTHAEIVAAAVSSLPKIPGLPTIR